MTARTGGPNPVTASRRSAGTEAPRDAAGAPFRGTRLQAPSVRPGILRRERLTGRLRASRQRLVLAVAPAGSGKTTLLADWAASDDRAFAWLSLDVADDDPATLWSDVAAAVAAVAGGGARVAPPQVDREADPARAVSDRIGSTEAELVLVLDDA